MIKGIYYAARKLDAGVKNMGLVANNLANLNSSGYKREIPFSELVDQAGAGQVRQVRDFGDGDFIQTGNPLDLAIKGNNFFMMSTDNGVALTRNGKLSISEDGFLVNNEGHKLLGKRGEININDLMLDNYNDLVITREGDIKIGDNTVDTLLIASVEDTQTLEKAGNLNFVAEDGNYNYADTGSYEVLQGHLEESNVNPIMEMESMIRISKDYESAQKVVSFIDQTLEKANDIGRV